jgi:hypothetical protein
MPFEKGETPKGAILFEKGQSGNPNGRPKKLPKLDDLLADILGSEEDKESEAHAILSRLVLDARAGNTKAAEILLDRAYGKAKQSIDHTSKGESINPTPIQFTWK